MIKLRDYQLEGNQATKDAFGDGMQRTGVSLFTGAGKTIMFCALAAELLAKDRRSIILVNRDTLADQTVRQLKRFVPDRAIGIVKADKNDVDSPIIVASAQTLARPNRLAQIRPPALTIVDEAHGSVSDTHLRYFEHVDAMPGGSGFLAGFTATWIRSDRRGLGDVWEDVVFERDARWAIKHKPPYLVEPKCIQLGGDLDLSSVSIGADGDYTDQSLGKIVMVDDLRETVVAGWQRFLKHRRAILFAPTQQSARYFGDALKAAGVRVGEIFANTSPTERKFTFAGFANGAVDVMITCVALAEGFDQPCCDAIMLLRPTNHIGMFIQQIGRSLRLWPGKTDALILDFVGVTDDKRMKSVVDLSVSPESNGCATITREKTNGSGSTIKGMAAKQINGVHQIDLFAGTDAKWLVTDKGIPFISTAQSLYYVTQVDGQWNIGHGSARTKLGHRWLATGLTSAEALERASEAAMEEDASIAGRSSSWRRGKPSVAQLKTAREMGLSVDGLNKAEVSDALSVYNASRVLANI